MSFSAQAIKSFLKKGEIRKLFIEGLGWDGGTSTKDCKVDEVTYGLKEVAVKAGFKVWLCEMTGHLRDDCLELGILSVGVLPNLERYRN